MFSVKAIRKRDTDMLAVQCKILASTPQGREPMRKQPFTIPIWAHKIGVEPKPGKLIISGERHIMSPAQEIHVDTDLLESSKPLARWGEQRRTMPPHVSFANATTDAKLIEFVRRWGPVDGDSKVIIGSSPSDKVLDVVATREIRTRLSVSVRMRAMVLEVIQDLAELRREQKLFASAARLIAECQTKKPNADEVFEHYSQLPESEDRKHFFRVIESVSHRGGSLASAACQRAQVALCYLLDRFPASLQLTKRGAVELPLLETKGIKSILYFFLRLEYLQLGRLGLGVCRHCDEVFAKERRGAVFCGGKCSSLYRGKEYYYEYGRARRQERNRNKNSEGT